MQLDEYLDGKRKAFVIELDWDLTARVSTRGIENHQADPIR